MYPGRWAAEKGDSAAAINAASGEVLSWRELDDRSNRVANLLRSVGLRVGDHIALLMENHLQYFEVAWAAFRSGLYITCINRYLTAEEAAYIVADSGAKAIVASAAVIDPSELAALIPDCPTRLLVRGQSPGWEPYEDRVAEHPTEPLREQPMGDSMLYSSGTTGRPKGIKRPLTGLSVTDGIPGLDRASPYGIDGHSVYLSPAPLYHAAPFGFCMRTQAMGGTVVMMERFDVLESLANIERYSITHSQWVPTMFVRMLKLEQAEREQFDLSSHRCAIHAAAPCPVAVKQQMMSWWGPIIWEYYAGTERNGSTMVGPQDWLAHPGTVGRARSGTLHICDEQGNEVETGEEGLIYFEQASRPFVYHNAPEKTAESGHPHHDNWTALGDVGYVDEEGYLYLTDRKAFLIISGGVNIYPREIEDALILNDKVADVAVFGVPNDEFGEEVKAVIQPAPYVTGTPELADELSAYAREHLAGFKVPRSFDFIDEMPRLPTGKLYKRILRDRYWE
ncbi:MAG: acyl-CoA synthetase [Gammaproteobacteria bacterium]|nr:acyl-CoA synthetase [Gammaproteobacteria bacterium]